MGLDSGSLFASIWWASCFFSESQYPHLQEENPGKFWTSPSCKLLSWYLRTHSGRRNIAWSIGLPWGQECSQLLLDQAGLSLFNVESPTLLGAWESDKLTLRNIPSSSCLIFFPFPLFPTALLLLLFWLRCTGCGIVVPRPEIKPLPPAVEEQCSNHWITSEVPSQHFLRTLFTKSF